MPMTYKFGEGPMYVLPWRLRHPGGTPRHTTPFIDCNPLKHPGDLGRRERGEHVRRLKRRETILRVRADWRSSRAWSTYFEVAGTIVDPENVNDIGTLLAT
jgi:hypothetical protein